MNQHDELDILRQQEEDEEADWEEYQIQMQIEEFLNPSDWVEYQLALQENPEPPECYDDDSMRELNMSEAMGHYTIGKVGKDE
mgnify:CR=1 FL=1